MNNNCQPGENYPNQPNDFQQQNPQSPMQQPTAPESIPDDPAPKKSKKGILIGLIAIVAVVITVVLCFTLFSSDDTASNKGGSLGDFDNGETTTVELYPDREVKEKELENFASVIADRAKTLGDNYEVTSDSEKITLTIAKSMLGSSSPERLNTLELLISRGTFAIDNDYFSLYNNPDKTDIKELEVVELDKEDILDDYKLAFLENNYAILNDIDSEEIYAVKVIFKKSADEKFDYKSGGYSGEKLVAFHDFLEDRADNEKTMGSVVLVDNDYTEAYIISSGAGYEKNAELMKVILEEKEQNFGLVAQFVDDPAWETDEKNMGKNQVKSMDGFTVFVEFTPDEYSRVNNSETDFAEFEKIVKDRMDTLGIEYMFGKTGLDNMTYCVSVYPEEFEANFFRMVFGRKNIEVRSAFANVFSPGILEKGEKDGKSAIVAKTSYTSEKVLAENEIPGNTVYLVVNDVTIASADITTIVEGEDEYYNSLYFTDFQCFGDIEVSEEEENILNLIASISNSSYHYIDGEYNFRTYGDNGEIVNSLGDISWKYEPLTARDKEVMAIVESHGYKFSKTVEQRNAITITAKFDVDKNLPQNFMNAFKELYAECNFDDGSYNEINFVIDGEKSKSPADTFRLRAYKYDYYEKILIEDSVGGPTFYDHWSDMYDGMKNDEFFVVRDFLNN